LIYCHEKELNIISEINYVNLWPFSFFPWLLSLALCPIQFFNASLGLLYFSPTITVSEVNIDDYIKFNYNVYVCVLLCNRQLNEASFN